MYKLVIYFMGGTTFVTTFDNEKDVEDFKKKIKNRRLLKKYNYILEKKMEGINIANMNAYQIYNKYNSDGKYIIDMPSNKTIICQSNAKTEELKTVYPTAIINPLGEWTGGLNVDTGATNRKLGSDMGKGVTGGGLHGKDLSKADVSINIYAFLKAQETGKIVELSCAIGDEFVDEKPYEEIVKQAKKYIQLQGGFEKFAEWGLF